MDFVKRPLAILTLTFFISFCVIANFGISLEWYFLLLLLPLPMLTLVFAYRPFTNKKLSLCLKYAFLLLTGIFLAFTLICLGPNDKKEQALYAERDGVCEVKIVYEMWENKQGFTYKAEILSVDENKEGFYVALKSKNEYKSGDVIRGTVYFSTPKSSESFDLQRYCLSKGITLSGVLYDGEVVRHEGKSVSVIFSDFSKRLQEKVRAALPERCSGLATAVVLGDKSGISDSTRRDLAAIGISHLIAVSGMHVSFISVAFYKIMSLLRINKRITAFICIFLMLFYMGIAGFSASVVRAAILSCMMSVLIITGLGYDGITAVGVCGSLMLLICPHFAYDVGMQLSFSAYLGCIAGSHLIKKLFSQRIPVKEKKNKKSRLRVNKRIKRAFSTLGMRLVSSAVFTVTVVLFTLPISCIYYDNLSLISPLSNLIFIPLFSIVMYAGIAVLFFSDSGFLGTLCAAAAEKIIDFVLTLSEKCASLEGITVSLNYSFAPYIIAFMFFGIMLFVCAKRKTALIGALCVILSVMMYASGVFGNHIYMKDKLDVSVINGRGGASLVICAAEETILLSGSAGSVTEAAAALNRALSLNKTGIDTLILTSYKETHLEFVETVCNSNYIKKVYLCSPSGSDEQKIKHSLTVFLEERSIDTISIDNMREVLKTKSCTLNFVKKDGDINAVYLQGRSTDYLYLAESWSDNTSGILKLTKENGERGGVAVFGSYAKSYKELKKAETYFPDKKIIAKTSLEELFKWSESYDSIHLFSAETALSVRVH